VVRVVVGREGRVAMQMEIVVRFDYGSLVPWVRRTEDGIVAVGGPNALRLRTSVPVRGEDLRTVAEFTVAAGERVAFSLGWYPSHEAAPPAADVDARLTATDAWWREWSSRCSYESKHRDAVVRSLITLKALTHTATGG